MSTDLLSIWERGLACTGPARALVLHRAARPGDDLRQARDCDLFALRRALFGDQMEVLAECSGCAEALEFDLDAAAFAAPPAHEGPHRIADDGWEVEFRPPTAGDLIAATTRQELLASCVLAARHDSRPVPADELPAAVQRLLAEAAERAEPTLRVSCPGCGAATSIRLDIAAYLWAEVDFWARDLLLDVHVLAGAYGWTEPEILALSPARRRYYLELCADA
jgi:hypothetical protein